MKKYDLILAAIYIIMTIVTVIDFDKDFALYSQINAQSEAITKNQEIKAVVISNSTAELEIYSLNEDSPKEIVWATKSRVTSEYLNNITIQNDTLRIDEIEHGDLSGVIKLSDSVHLEIINSPNVKLLTDEEFATRVAQNPEKYDF